MIKRAALHQDNESTAKLIVNDRSSCGKRSRHDDIRYFFLKDRVEKGEFEVKYCPTEKMISGFFTKPLQGAQFKRLSAVVMGEISYKAFMDTVDPAPKERVGESRSADLLGLEKSPTCPQ